MDSINRSNWKARAYKDLHGHANNHDHNCNMYKQEVSGNLMDAALPL
jgi:hypothetical protein